MLRLTLNTPFVHSCAMRGRCWSLCLVAFRVSIYLPRNHDEIATIKLLKVCPRALGPACLSYCLRGSNLRVRREHIADGHDESMKGRGSPKSRCVRFAIAPDTEPDNAVSKSTCTACSDGFIATDLRPLSAFPFGSKPESHPNPARG